MKKIFAFFYIFLLFSPPATAVTRIKVKKTKGQMALVQFQGELKTGDSFIAVPEEQDAGEMRSGPRKNRIGFNFAFNSLKTKTSTGEYTPSLASLTGEYGWNRGIHEFGPILGYTSEGSGFGATTVSVDFGGFYDYNFSANTEPLNYLFGTGLRATYTTITAASGETGLYRTKLYPNFFWKWFPFGQATALRLDVGFELQNAKDSSTTGIQSSGALLVYY